MFTKLPRPCRPIPLIIPLTFATPASKSWKLAKIGKTETMAALTSISSVKSLGIKSRNVISKVMFSRPAAKAIMSVTWMHIFDAPGRPAPMRFASLVLPATLKGKGIWNVTNDRDARAA
jgi:hypothetical protein